MKQIDSVIPFRLALSFLCAILSLSGMNQKTALPSPPIPTLKDLALSAIAKNVKRLVTDVNPHNLDQTVALIESEYHDKLPSECLSDITARMSNYRCTTTLNMGAYSPTSLLLTRLRMLVSNAGKKINLYGLDQHQTQPITALNGHTKSVTALALSSQGSLLVSGSHDTTIKLWNILKPQEPCYTTLTEHANSIVKLLLADEDKILFSASTDGTAILWDISDPHNVHRIKTIPINLRAAKTMTTTPDGMSIMYGEHNAIKYLNINNIQEIRSQKTLVDNTQLITSLACSESLVAVGSVNKKVLLYEKAKNGTLQLLTTLTGHKGAINALEFSDTGNILASGSHDKKIKLWDTSCPKEKRYLRTLFGHKGAVKKLKFICNSNLLVSISDDNMIKIWDITDPTQADCISTLSGHTRFLTDLAYHPTTDQATLLSKAADRTIKIWQPKSIPYAAFEQAINTVHSQDEYNTVYQQVEASDLVNIGEKKALTDLLQAQKKYINKSS